MADYEDDHIGELFSSDEDDGMIFDPEAGNCLSGDLASDPLHESSQKVQQLRKLSQQEVKAATSSFNLPCPPPRSCLRNGNVGKWVDPTTIDEAALTAGMQVAEKERGVKQGTLRRNDPFLKVALMKSVRSMARVSTNPRRGKTDMNDLEKQNEYQRNKNYKKKHETFSGRQMGMGAPALDAIDDKDESLRGQETSEHRGCVWNRYTFLAIATVVFTILVISLGYEAQEARFGSERSVSATPVPTLSSEVTSAPTLGSELTAAPTLEATGTPSAYPTPFPTTEAPTDSPIKSPTPLPTIPPPSVPPTGTPTVTNSPTTLTSIESQVAAVCAASTGNKAEVGMCIDSSHFAQCNNGAVTKVFEACAVGVSCDCAPFLRVLDRNPCSASGGNSCDPDGA